MMQYRVKISGDDQYIGLYVKTDSTLNQLELSRCEDKRWYINRLIVQPAIRNKGIATALMGELIKIADHEEYTLILEVNSYGDMSNENLKVFFARFGFIGNGLIYERKFVEINNGGSNYEFTGKTNPSSTGIVY